MNDSTANFADLATRELDYALPPGLIATRPAEPRDSARLMVVRRSAPDIAHATVRDLPEFLQQGDNLVFNTTAVVPARFQGARQSTGRTHEGLYLQTLHDGRWRCLLRGRLKAGDRLALLDRQGKLAGTEMELVESSRDGWTAVVTPPAPASSILNEIGFTPLPPYIIKARGHAALSDDDDRRWYQTVYAETSQAGSVAAPTAGLHFTPGLLQRVEAGGVHRRRVTLHVGIGTFKPVEADRLADHPMHEEWFHVPPETLDILRAGSASRVIAVGTTTVRAMESLPQPLPEAGGWMGETRLLIAPGFPLRFVDGLMTNFHLPRSTLLALVAAFVGLDRLRELYAEAVRTRYRFYSYGDAMLILP